MSSIRNKNKKNSLKIEKKIEIAIRALKNKKIIFIHEAARLYNISYYIFFYWLNSHSSCTILRANSYQLTETEEEIFIQWILDLIKQELLSRPAFVKNMMNYFFIIQDSIFFISHVNKNWISNLIKCCTKF